MELEVEATEMVQLLTTLLYHATQAYGRDNNLHIPVKKDVVRPVQLEYNQLPDGGYVVTFWEDDK